MNNKDRLWPKCVSPHQMSYIRKLTTFTTGSDISLLAYIDVNAEFYEYDISSIGKDLNVSFDGVASRIGE